MVKIRENCVWYVNSGTIKRRGFKVHLIVILENVSNIF